MKSVHLFFEIKDNRVIVILENPDKYTLKQECENLDTWDGYFVSLQDGSVYSLRQWILELI